MAKKMKRGGMVAGLKPKSPKMKAQAGAVMGPKMAAMGSDMGKGMGDGEGTYGYKRGGSVNAKGNARRTRKGMC